MPKRDKQTQHRYFPLNFTKSFPEHLCVTASEKTTSTTTLLRSMSISVQLFFCEFRETLQNNFFSRTPPGG